jgi:hypothetical protein
LRSKKTWFLNKWLPGSCGSREQESGIKEAIAGNRTFSSFDLSGLEEEKI